MTWEAVDRLMRSGLSKGVFPGAVLLASREDRTLFHQAYGWADLFGRRKITLGTSFDLASLTKPLATVLAVMFLVQHRGLDMDRPCRFYCPALEGTDKGGITIRHLLSHRSGLVAWRPYYMHLRRLPPGERGRQLRRWLLREPLQAPPGEQAEYSDIGFLLLQWILESMINRSLISFVVESIYHPAGLSDLYFPALDPASARREVAATELCPWRNRLLVDEVHDDNAAVLGGAAAHAGLFGTAGAVHRLLSLLMGWDLQDPGRSMFDAKMVDQFCQPQEGAEWALGFDTPSPHGSSAGRGFSSRSIGHLGYTGTSFWVDLRRQVIVVLLSNRVHPTRYNDKIREFRPRLHDAVMDRLG